MISAHSKLKRKYFLILTPILVFIGLFFLVHLDPLQIKNQIITLNNVPCASEIAIQDAAHLQGQNILLVNSEAVQRVLGAKFLCVDQVKISRQTLNNVKLDVTGRKAILKISSATESSPPAQFTDEMINQLEEASPSSQSAAIASIDYQTDYFENISSNNENLLTDETGLLFYQGSSDNNLPEVTFIHPMFKLGDKLDQEQVHEIELILTKLKALSISVDSLRVRDATAVVKSQNPTYLLFNLDGSVDRQLASLQLILKQITMDSGGGNISAVSTKSIESIDFRFDKPVLVYSSK